MNPQIDTLIDFWREVVADGRWMRKDDAFDQLFRDSFLDLHMDAARRRCDDWIESPDGALALMVLLDQFPRNAFRETAHMYATDGLACMYARDAARRGWPDQVEEGFRVFFIFPFTHSEDPADQAMSITLGARISEERAQRVSGHRDIIRRFGRFPHRNPVLGREHTREESAFLAEGGFTG